MHFSFPPFLPPEIALQHPAPSIVNVLRPAGPDGEYWQVIGWVRSCPQHYSAIRFGVGHAFTATQTFAEEEKALLWVCAMPQPPLQTFGLVGIFQEVFCPLWRFDRGQAMVGQHVLPLPTLKTPWTMRTTTQALALMGSIVQPPGFAPKPTLQLKVSVLQAPGFLISRTKNGWSSSFPTRCTKRSLTDLLLKMVDHTAQGSLHHRLEDKRQALESLDGIEERVDAYFERFSDYQTALQRPV